MKQATLLFALLTTSLQATVILDINGLIESTDPTQTGRILRNGTPSEWNSQKPYPGLNDSNLGRHFDSYTLSVPSYAGPVFYEFQLIQASTALFHLAYTDPYNPANLGQNYLGDAGSSGMDMSYRVNVASGLTSLIAVVHEVNINGGGSYRLIVNAYSDVNRTDLPTEVPEPATATVCMAALGLLAARRHRRCK